MGGSKISGIPHHHCIASMPATAILSRRHVMIQCQVIVSNPARILKGQLLSALSMAVMGFDKSISWINRIEIVTIGVLSNSSGLHDM